MLRYVYTYEQHLLLILYLDLERDGILPSRVQDAQFFVYLH